MERSAREEPGKAPWARAAPLGCVRGTNASPTRCREGQDAPPDTAYWIHQYAAVLVLQFGRSGVSPSMSREKTPGATRATNALKTSGAPCAACDSPTRLGARGGFQGKEHAHVGKRSAKECSGRIGLLLWIPLACCDRRPPRSGCWRPFLSEPSGCPGKRTGRANLWLEPRG